jgi:hypothetical protein
MLTKKSSLETTQRHLSRITRNENATLLATFSAQADNKQQVSKTNSSAHEPKTLSSTN